MSRWLNLCFFLTAVDVFAATMQYELIAVKDGKTLLRGRDDVCPQYPELCSLPTGGKYPPEKLKQDECNHRG